MCRIWGVPTCNGVHPADVGEAGEGTKGVEPFGDEAIRTIRASDGRHGKGSIILLRGVRQRLCCCLCDRGESKREGSSGER